MSCGACSLCCKVLDVPDLQKAGGKWCVHALPGKGCGVYDIRPDDANYPGAADRGLMGHTLAKFTANGIDVAIAEANRVIPMRSA